MTTVHTPETMPTTANRGEMVNAFLEYDEKLSERFGEQGQTTEQLQDTMRLYSRNPYFNTSAYTDEPEPDIYDLQEADEVGQGEVVPAEQLSLMQERLEIAREQLADLSVRLRGKTFKQANKALRATFNELLQEYKDAYKHASNNGAIDLELEGKDPEEINTWLIAANTSEHARFIDAERAAYERQNPRLGKVTQFWARTGMVKRALMSGGAGTAVTVVATGLVAATGVGLLAGGAAALSVKAAKSIGMYKLNKGSRTVKEFDAKAAQDAQVVAYANNVKVSQLDEKNTLAISETSADVLASVLRDRVELDQKKNRNRLALAVGMVATGAFIGSLLHDVVKGDGRPSGVTTPPQTPQAPRVTAETPTGTTAPEMHEGTRPSSQPVSRTPEAPAHPTTPPIVEEPPVPAAPVETSLPEAPVTPAAPVEVPTAPAVPVVPPAEAVPVPAAPQLPDLDYTRYTWSVAHDLMPGQETVVMQRGIDAFNSLHNTQFALTPHNGSIWIMDNGLSINPAQMEELNRLMAEELITA
jgi:hypothetical protein